MLTKGKDSTKKTPQKQHGLIPKPWQIAVEKGVPTGSIPLFSRWSNRMFQEMVEGYTSITRSWLLHS